MKLLLSLLCISVLIYTPLQLFAQCEGYEHFPGGKELGKKQYITYRNLMKAGDFEAAFEAWQKLYEHAPAGNVQHYLDGVVLHRQMMKKATEAREVVLLQSALLKLYDRRMKCFGYKAGTENVIIAEKAVEMYHLNYDENVTRRTYKYVLESGEKRVPPEFISTYAALVTYLYGAERMNIMGLTELKMVINQLANHNIQHAAEDYMMDLYQTAKTEANQYFDIYLPTVSDCAAHLEGYKAEVAENPDDKALKLEILNKLEAMSCEPDSSFLVVLNQAIEDLDIDKNDPLNEAKGIFGLPLLSSATAKKAKTAFINKEYKVAIELYEQAITETGNKTQKAKYAYRIAEIYYQQLYDKKRARAYAFNADALDADWGQPLMLIGDMYAASYLDCVKKERIESRHIVLAAVDKWKAAKTTNPALEKVYQAKIAKHADLIPNVEDLQCDNTIEKMVEIGCWIKEKVMIWVCEGGN